MLFDLIIKKPQNIKNDLLSGITVALALVPEAIAFSFVAHVDPVLGLYAAFLMGFVTSLFGGRPGMISGATGAVAVIFAPLVMTYIPLVGMDGAVSYLLVAVILMGLLQVTFGLLRWGKFVRLIPYPVMLGFVNGLAIVIFKSQLAQFYTKVDGLSVLLPVVPLLTMLGLVFVTMGIAHYLPKWTTVVPASLVAILSVTGLSFFLKSFGFEVYTVIDYVQQMDASKVSLSASFPSFHVPSYLFSWETIKIVFPYSVLAAAVGLIESLMTLSLVDELTKTRGQGNRESIFQGVANIANGFFGGMGGCAMIGQSMINIRAGGRGRLSGFSASCCLLLFVMFGADFIEQIPLAALVGIMFMVVIATFEWSSFRIINKIPRPDALVLVMVSLVTVFFDLAVAVIVGVIVSSLVFAWKKSIELKANKSFNKNGVRVYSVEGHLFFGSVSSFKELFDFSGDPDEIIIDFKRSRICDHSALEAIDNLTKQYAELGKTLHLLNVSSDCQKLLVQAQNIVEISVLDQPYHYVADNRLG